MIRVGKRVNPKVRSLLPFVPAKKQQYQWYGKSFSFATAPAMVGVGRYSSGHDVNSYLLW